MIVKPKKKRNPAKTRARLLAAGVMLFSERGYDGVAVDEIVREAAVNKRMLYHYFGSKDGLYVEVLREVFGRLDLLEAKTLDGAVSLEEALRDILASYFQFLEDHPEFVSLLMWENLNRGRFLDSHPELLSKSIVLKRLREIVKRAKENGEIAASVDARQLLVLLYGVCFFYWSNRFTLKHTVGLDLTKSAVIEKGLHFTQRALLHGLLL